MTELVLPSVQALIFDVDGTLCDSATLHYEAWRRVGTQFGVTIPTWQVYVEECLRNQRRFEDSFDLRGTASLVKSALYEAKSGMFRQIALSSLKPFAGVVELWTHACILGLHLAVVSTARRRSVEDILEILRLPKPGLIIAREDVAPHVKPDPTGYRLVIDSLRLNPSSCVAFEDSPSGIQSAVSAGIPCLAMTSPVFSEEEQEGGLLLLSSLEDVDLVSSGEGVADLIARGGLSL